MRPLCEWNPGCWHGIVSRNAAGAVRPTGCDVRCTAPIVGAENSQGEGPCSRLLWRGTRPRAVQATDSSRERRRLVNPVLRKWLDDGKRLSERHAPRPVEETCMRTTCSWNSRKTCSTNEGVKPGLKLHMNETAMLHGTSCKKEKEVGRLAWQHGSAAFGLFRLWQCPFLNQQEKALNWAFNGPN